MEERLEVLLEDMEAANISSLVNLDGRWGSELEENLDRYDRAHPGRFYTFCHLDWRLLDSRNGPDRLAESLRRSVEAGARGLKVWKDLGLNVRARGRDILPDDPLLEPVWEEASKLKIPVLIHVADPIAFFLPADRRNERLEQMLRDPKGARHPGGPSHFHRLIDSLEHLIASEPKTTFVGAHACCPENLAHVSTLLTRYPNFSIDISSAASELGRQPRAARALIIGHPRQVIFGTDIFPIRQGTRQIYFRLLETADESFSYSVDHVPPCGRWSISGLDLPPTILASVYRENAESLLT